MSANPKAVAHYRAAEDHARDVEKARKTIHALRLQLHECISELQDISLAFKGENEEWDALIQRSKDTLLDTLPGAELDAAPLVGREAGTSASSLLPAGGDALDALDAMSPKERGDVFVNVIKDICWAGAGMPGKPPR